MQGIPLIHCYVIFGLKGYIKGSFLHIEPAMLYSASLHGT